MLLRTVILSALIVVGAAFGALAGAANPTAAPALSIERPAAYASYRVRHHGVRHRRHRRYGWNRFPTHPGIGCYGRPPWYCRVRPRGPGLQVGDWPESLDVLPTNYEVAAPRFRRARYVRHHYRHVRGLRVRG